MNTFEEASLHLHGLAWKTDMAFKRWQRATSRGDTEEANRLDHVVTALLDRRCIAIAELRKLAHLGEDDGE